MNGKDKRRAGRLRGEPDATTRDEYSSPGTIITVFPDDYACRVRDDLKGAEYDVAVPGLIQDSEGSGGEVYIPRRGQRVELKFGGGMRPRISGCLPQTFDVNITGNETPSLFEHSQGSLNVYGNASNNFRGYMPGGLMSGDWCRVGNLGQHIGVFDGGVTVLHGSKWAQIRAVGGQGADTLSLFGRRMGIHTDFGDITFGSDSGKSYVELLGGTDQTLESGVDRQNWTVRGAIGKGEGIANFAIMDRDGNPVHKTVIEADGTITRIQTGDNSSTFSGNQSMTYERSYERNVLSGDDTVTVADGNRNENYGGSRLTVVQKNQETSVLADDSLISGGNIFRSCQTFDVNVDGRLTALPTQSAATWNVSNGSFDINVGKPPTDLNTALSSFNVTVWPAGGKATLKSMLGSVETFSSIETKIESAALINLFAGGIFKAEAGGLMQLKAGGAMMGEATGVMQMTSKGPSMFGSSAVTQLGGLSAVEPVLKGLTMLVDLGIFLGACSAAGKTSSFGGGSVPSLNGAGLIAIGTAADILLGKMSAWPSLKVLTE